MSERRILIHRMIPGFGSSLRSCTRHGSWFTRRKALHWMAYLGAPLDVEEIPSW